MATQTEPYVYTFLLSNQIQLAKCEFYWLDYCATDIVITENGQ
jgi:hypothetical protein